MRYVVERYEYERPCNHQPGPRNHLCYVKEVAWNVIDTERNDLVDSCNTRREAKALIERLEKE